jgi:hypothetical protein
MKYRFKKNYSYSLVLRPSRQKSVSRIHSYCDTFTRKAERIDSTTLDKYEKSKSLREAKEVE